MRGPIDVQEVVIPNLFSKIYDLVRKKTKNEKIEEVDRVLVESDLNPVDYTEEDKLEWYNKFVSRFEDSLAEELF
jgi:hypothetical protein